ncbi:winged helix-turn-helix domain-containing protein [Pseudoclavibacter sp. CFCC 11306]|uniref:winged helix-turn-helix domain-containing protein n=1 Tax=Pseudoclavibacter sp. CFCC 11306 TaxID=1564493 RepID=UPI001300CC94|nr:winged helix-turn-helix domain-containing protein [Pseudoclavibacter sp. CFCC 11306]KAB1657499.1 winged helix-turn-helix transcriptional regulator [Pseudoclavibacter sp. CFCC 11306]
MTTSYDQRSLTEDVQTGDGARNAHSAHTQSAHTTRPASRQTDHGQHPHARRDENVEARGFALYVGFDEVSAAASGVSLQQLVAALKETAEALVPDIKTHATLAIAPRGAGGRDVDVVRLALRDPAAQRARQQERQTHRRGVVIDFSRQRVLVDGQEVALTYKEFHLLGHLVEHEGETVHRNDLLADLWDEEAEGVPNERTIDVHVRRLRAKLGDYQEIVRTVRGIGYRFDRHADVAVKAD